MLFYKSNRASGKTTELLNVLLNERAEGINTFMLVPNYLRKRFIERELESKFKNAQRDYVKVVDNLLLNNLLGLRNVKLLVDEPADLNDTQIEILKKLEDYLCLCKEDIYGIGA